MVYCRNRYLTVNYDTDGMLESSLQCIDSRLHTLIELIIEIAL